MRTLRRIILTVLATALVLELVLQLAAVIAALVLGSRAAPDASAAGGGSAARARVLCVGDSYTYGQGASTREASYPMVMERWLRAERGLDVEVVNAGWPGQDSRDVLLALGGQLDQTHPRLVCILVGCNDRWNRPRQVQDLGATAASGTGFRLRWRTARLLRWALRERASSARREASTSGPPPPTPAMLATARELREQAGLQLRNERPPPPPVVRTPDAVRGAARARELLGQDRPEEARDELLSALGSGPDAELVCLLVQACSRLDEQEQAEQALTDLRALHGSEASVHHGVQLLTALCSLGHMDEALDLGRGLVAEHPQSFEAWVALAQIPPYEDPATVATAQRRALESAGPITPELAYLAAGLGRARAAEDPAAATCLLCAGLLLEGAFQLTPATDILVCKDQLRPEVIERAIDLPGLDERGRELLAQARAEVLGRGDGAWLEVLGHHLEQIVSLARSAGAEVILVGYPFATPHDPLLEALALERELTLVEPRERFQQELQQRDRTDLFVADGHCNDAGYALLAGQVGAAAADLLER